MASIYQEQDSAPVHANSEITPGQSALFRERFAQKARASRKRFPKKGSKQKQEGDNGIPLLF